MTSESLSNRGLTRRRALASAAALGSIPGVLGTGVSKAVAGPTPSSDLRAMLREIDPENIKGTILKLVSFGTRNTLSSQDDPTRGIGAARDWLLAEFQKAAAPSGGRMTVEAQHFIQQPGPRVPSPTPITNIIATLRGSRADSADRTYVVSGHYDSMPTDVTDPVSDAPGANDDASGVAAVLEMARGHGHPAVRRHHRVHGRRG
jgi:Peptidase family M28